MDRSPKTTNSSSSTARPAFLEKLIHHATVRGSNNALVFKHRGVWQNYSWAAAADQIDAIAAGLAKLGVVGGSAIAIHGEVTARVVIIAAAARTLGARLLSVPLAESRDDLEAIIRDASVQLVIAHRRETVGEWQRLAKLLRTVAIVFDHVTPDSRSPDDGILTYAQLLALAPKRGWNGWTSGPRSLPPYDVTWFEETTDWDGGIDFLLDHWIDTGTTIAVPEIHVAAARDREELQPTNWIASIRQVEKNVALVRARLPDRTTIARRLLDGVLNGRGAPWFGLLRWKVRRQLGVGRIFSITLNPDHGQSLQRHAADFLNGLNITALHSANAITRVSPRTGYADVLTKPASGL